MLLSVLVMSVFLSCPMVLDLVFSRVAFTVLFPSLIVVCPQAVLPKKRETKKNTRRQGVLSMFHGKTSCDAA